MSSMVRRRERAWWTAGAVALLVIAGGCGLNGVKDEPVADPMVVVVSDSPEEVLPDTAEPEPEPTTAKPKPKPSRTTARPKPKPSRTEDPNNFEAPACADYIGKQMSKKAAAAALNAAAGKIYWPTQAPELKLSRDLVRSVAWHESGWQSNIVNCDGGYGLMQVMPDTVDMINNRFGESYDSHDYRQNALAGANYLAWLTKYFGEKFFQDKYDLSTSKCKNHSSPCLLNLVIAAYNAGHGTVEEARRAGRPLPNLDYVDSVRSLMRSCYCDRY